MLNSLLKYTLIATVLGAGAAQAQSSGSMSGYLTSGAEQPVRSGYGDCWRTGSWTQERAAAQCDPQPALEPQAALQPQPEVERASYSAEVLFGFERAELADEGRKVLDDVAQKLLAIDPEAVAVTAHADRIGSAAYNEQLSARRAEAIRAYLVDKGVPEKLVRFEAKGAREPVTAGRCDAMGPENKQNAKLVACLQPDRRVEIEIAGRYKR